MDQKRGLASWIREAYEIARISLDRGVSRKESKATTVDVAQPRAQRPRSPGQPEERRIDTAAQEHTDGAVTDQMPADGPIEDVPCVAQDGSPGAKGRPRGCRDVPIAIFQCGVPWTEGDPASGLDLGHPLIHA